MSMNIVLLEERSLHICYTSIDPVHVLHFTSRSQVGKDVDELLNIGWREAMSLLAHDPVVGRPVRKCGLRQLTLALMLLGFVFGPCFSIIFCQI